MEHPGPESVPVARGLLELGVGSGRGASTAVTMPPRTATRTWRPLHPLVEWKAFWRLVGLVAVEGLRERLLLEGGLLATALATGGGLLHKLLVLECYRPCLQSLLVRAFAVGVEELEEVVIAGL